MKNKVNETNMLEYLGMFPDLADLYERCFNRIASTAKTKYDSYDQIKRLDLRFIGYLNGAVKKQKETPAA